MSGRRDRMKYGGNSCDGLEVTADDLHGHSDSKHSNWGLPFTPNLNPDIGGKKPINIPVQREEEISLPKDF